MPSIFIMYGETKEKVGFTKGRVFYMYYAGSKSNLTQLHVPFKLLFACCRMFPFGTSNLKIKSN